MVRQDVTSREYHPAIGLLGGSFNPAHSGHVYISRVAIRALRLKTIWWLISPQNPLKSVEGMASLAWRIAKARKVASSCSRIHVSDIESKLDTQYSVDVLRFLLRRYPHQRFVWLIGADNFVQLPYWRQWSHLFRMIPIAIFSRYPYSLEALTSVAARRFSHYRISVSQAHNLAKRKPPAWVFFPVRPHSTSATQIRSTATVPRNCFLLRGE